MSKPPRDTAKGPKNAPYSPRQLLFIKIFYAGAALFISALLWWGINLTKRGDVQFAIGFGIVLLIYVIRTVAQIIRKRSPVVSLEPWRFAAFGSIAFSLYVNAFSSSYFAIGGGQASCLAGPIPTESMSHLDALYFTVTTLTTVGYGDWHPVTEICRGVVIIQQVTGFILFGIMLGVILSIYNALRPNR